VNMCHAMMTLTGVNSIAHDCMHTAHLCIISLLKVCLKSVVNDSVIPKHVVFLTALSKSNVHLISLKNNCNSGFYRK